MEKQEKIYISGHNGMVGGALLRKLRSDGYTNIVTRSHSELDLVSQANTETFFSAEKPDYVFHVAAKTGGVMLNKEHPTEYLAENVFIALNVLEAAHKHGAKGVVYLSSANIYSENAPQPMNEELFQAGKPPFFLGGVCTGKNGRRKVLRMCA